MKVLSYICNNHYYKKEKIKIKSIKYNGNTIRLSLTHSSKFDKINKIRDNCINVCEENDGMGSYHVTLAYKYKDIDTDTFKLIDDEIKKSNNYFIKSICEIFYKHEKFCSVHPININLKVIYF